MYATWLHHSRECAQSAPAVRVSPQPKGVGIALFKCSSCGAVASTPRSTGG